MSIIWPGNNLSGRQSGNVNEAKRTMMAKYSGVCAKCGMRFAAGTLVVQTFEHYRCGPPPEVPEVLRGLIRDDPNCPS